MEHVRFKQERFSEVLDGVMHLNILITGVQMHFRLQMLPVALLRLERTSLL